MTTARTVKRKKGVVYRAEDTEEALRNNGYVGNAPPDDMLFDDASIKILAQASAIDPTPITIPVT